MTHSIDLEAMRPHDLTRVTHHAIVRWLERASDIADEVERARADLGAEASDRAILEYLEGTLPGFHRSLVARRIMERGGAAAISMSASAVMVDGLSFMIQCSEGRRVICTGVCGQRSSGFHNARQERVG